jgi:hypothetical protein
MWRAYAANGGIALRSTTARLRWSLGPDRQIHIAPIVYVDRREGMIELSTPYSQALWKQPMYRDEHEVRAVFYDHEAKGAGVLVPVRLHELVEQVVLLPWGPSYLDDAVRAITEAFAPGLPVGESDLRA